MSIQAVSHLALRRLAIQSRNQTPRLSALRQFHTTERKMVVHTVEDQAAFNEIVKTKPIVVVDAFAVWCGPCKAISPVVDKFSESPAFSNIYFVKIDVDELPDLSQELGISAMPTFIAFKNGEIADKVVGASVPKIETMLNGLLDA
ncbi:thioredoxin-like protein [Nemania sp. FL0916]|nr:thioredoxin-like protein [Nemania sp. FL0916]